MVLIRPCKTTAAYEAIPESDLDLDIPRVESKLGEKGWTAVANAGIMLVVRKGLEATVFQSGKLLIKTQDATAAQAVWNEIGPVLQEATHEP